jgi:hypothetical protein
MSGGAAVSARQVAQERQAGRSRWIQWPAPSISSLRLSPGTVSDNCASAFSPAGPRITPSLVPAMNSAG